MTDTVDPSAEWNTRVALLKCKNRECIRSPVATGCSISVSRHPKVPFGFGIRCPTCPDNWYVCTICAKATARYRSEETIIKHCRNKHQDWLSTSELVKQRAPKQKYSTQSVMNGNLTKRRKTLSTETSSTLDDGGSADAEITTGLLLGHQSAMENESDENEGMDFRDDASVDGDNDNTIDVTTVLKQSDIGIGCRETSAAYFFNENKVKGGGLDYLVGMAKWGLPNLHGCLDKDEVSMYAKTAEFASKLTKPNRHRLANLTKQICDVVKKQTIEGIEVSSGSRPPRPFVIEPLQTPNEIRMQFFDSEKSLFRILPYPPLFECEGHTYSLYSDCVRDALGKGFDLEYITPTDGLVDDQSFPISDIPTTKRCKKLFDLHEHINGNHPILTIDVYMNEWSDDADPNSSIKGNRSSFWLKSVTISPTKKMVHSSSHTYPLALGRKNTDHEIVGVLLSQDLLSLGSDRGVPMYSEKHGGIVQVRAKLYACLMDQPERRGENHLLAGNSNLHKRFGYSFPWHEFEDVLRPCQNCRDLLLDESEPWDDATKCEDCTNFACDPFHERFLIKAPEFFPFALLPGEMLGPLRLSYHLLANAVKNSHDFMVDGVWSVKEATSYLEWHCLKDKSLKAIIRHADHCREHAEVMKDPLSTDAEKAASTRQKARHPDLYEPWPIPSLWQRGVLLKQSPDVPMHLLFLGIVKTTMLRVQEWMANKRKMNPFVQAMKQQFESIDELKLSWIKTLPYKAGRFGGWVSENYLAISRLLKWFYSSLDSIASDEAPWVPPNKPMDKWSMKDNIAWLKERDLPRAKMNAVELREQVELYITGVEPVPPIVDMSAGPVETVMATVSSLDEMISLIMVQEITSEAYYTVLARKIRIFLTHFADMEEALPTKKRLPTWLSCYNFLSLLNLPDVIRQYGPIRNIWEGAAQGEGILRFVKPNVSNGMRRAWEYATMRTLMRKKAMGEVADTTVGTEAFVASKENAHKMYHTYDKTEESLDHVLREARAVVSCVQLMDGRWGIVTRGGKGVEIFTSLDRSNMYTIKTGLHYYVWHRTLGADQDVLRIADIASFGLMLPLLQYGVDQADHAYVTHTYALIDSQHRTLDDLGNLFYA